MVKTLLFLGLKYRGNLLSYCSNLPQFQGKLNVINIPMVIYCHPTVIIKVMLLYNTEWWYYNGMVVNYRIEKFYIIGFWLPDCSPNHGFNRFNEANGTVGFKNVNNCSNTNISLYLQTSGGQSYNLYLNVVHFFRHQC